eukprot:gene8709-655_t
MLKKLLLNKRLLNNTIPKLYSTQEDIFIKYPKAKPHGDVLKQAIMFFETNKLEEATKLFEESSTNLSEELPKNHPLLGIAFNNFAECLRKHSPKEIEKIEKLYQISLDIWTEKENENIFSSQLGTLYNNIGLFYLENKKDYEKALENFNKSEILRYELLKAQKDLASLNEVKGQLGITLNNKGLSYHYLNKFDEAIPCFTESINLLKGNFSNNPIFISVLNNISMSLMSMDKLQEAEKYLEDSIERISRNPNQISSYEGGLTYANFAKLKYQLKEFKEAEDIYRRSLTILKNCLPEDHKQIGLVMANLAVCVMENKGSKTEIYKLTKTAQKIALKHSSNDILNSLLKFNK